MREFWLELCMRATFEHYVGRGVPLGLICTALLLVVVTLPEKLANKGARTHFPKQQQVINLRVTCNGLSCPVQVG